MEGWTYVGRLYEDFRQGADGFYRLHCKLEGRYISILYRMKAIDDLSSRGRISKNSKNRTNFGISKDEKKARNIEIYCIDAICYHAGGPLSLGDIEEVRYFLQNTEISTIALVP